MLITSVGNQSPFALANDLQIGPTIAGIRTYIGAGSKLGLLVDENNNDFLLSVPPGQQKNARQAASDYLDATGRPNAYQTPPSTNQNQPAVSYSSASLLPQQTYTSDASQASYATNGQVASGTTTASTTNPYGDVPQTVTLGHSPRDVQALTPQQIAALTNAQVKSLNGGQIHALSTAQIAALSQREVWDLSGDQLSQLSPTQFGGFSSTQLQTLTASQIQALNQQQIAALSPQQVASFLPSQIPALGGRQLEALNDPQLQALTTPQINALLTVQIRSLYDEQIAAFTTQQIVVHPAYGTLSSACEVWLRAA